MKPARPPRLAQWVLRSCAPPTDKEILVADLDEEFATSQLPALGRSAARAWYLRQVRNSVFSLLALRLQAAALATFAFLLAFCLLLSAAVQLVKLLAPPDLIRLATYLLGTGFASWIGTRVGMRYSRRESWSPPRFIAIFAGSWIVMMFALAPESQPIYLWIVWPLVAASGAIAAGRASGSQIGAFR